MGVERCVLTSPGSFGEVRFETAGEKAVEHPVRKEPGETDADRRVATNGVTSARPLAGDRVSDDPARRFGRQPLGDGRLGL